MLKKSAINIILLFVSILVFLMIFELFLRLFMPQPLNPLLFPTTERETFGQYDPELGWSLKPDIESPFFSSEYNVLVKQNQYGMRDKVYKKENDPKKIRIAVAGDSFAWGFGVENNQTFAKVLEEKLGKNFEVLNFGVSGYGTDQEFLQFKSRILEFKPDILIITFFPNDIENIMNSVQYGYNKPLFILDNGKLKLTNMPVPITKEEKAQYGLKDYINFFLSHYSNSYIFLKSGIKSLYNRIVIIFDKYPEYLDTKILKKNYDKQYIDGWTLFDHLIGEFKNIGSRNNITIVLMNIPTKTQIDEDLLGQRLRVYGTKREDYDIWKPSRLLNQYADENNVTFIDILPYLLSEDSPKGYYFKYDEHLNVKGHEFIAEWLDKELIKKKVIKPNSY